MPTAVVLGFQYGEAVNIVNPLRKLEAAIIDVYRACRYSQMQGWKIYLITDIETPVMPCNIGATISAGIVDIGITTFLRQDLGEDQVKVISYTVTNSSQFDKAMNEIVCDDNRCFFYYSGHGVKDAMLLPSRESYNFENIFEMIMKSVKTYTDSISKPVGNNQIIALVDCCNGCNVSLPFAISTEKKRFVLQKIPRPRWLNERVIWITSSTDGMNAEHTEQGSLFTARFFRLIMEGKYNLSILLQELRSRQDIGQGFYASYLEQPVMYPWFYGSTVDIRPGEDVLRLNTELF